MTLHYNLFVAGGLDANSLLARALVEKRTRALNRTLTLLGLIQGPDDVAIVRHALRIDDARLRSRAIEYLDNLLEGDTRKRVMLLVEEMPAEERIRKGNVMYRTRTRDVEDTLAQLLHDEDQSIASAAVLMVEEKGLWSLAGDLEHVLEHRDVRDQHVFEAASWALAANRVKADRRKQLWQEPLPAVELADRLRHIPLFDFTHIHELFRLARLGRQVRHETGRTLYARGAAVHAVQFLLDGQVAIAGPDGKQDVRAPAALGVEELLEGAPMRAVGGGRRAGDHAVDVGRRFPRPAVGERRARGRHLPHDDRVPRPRHGPDADPRHARAGAQGQGARRSAGHRSRVAAASEPAARARHGGAFVAAVGDCPAGHDRLGQGSHAEGQRRVDPDRAVRFVAG